MSSFGDDSSRRSLKLVTSRPARYKQPTGRGGAANATSSVLSQDCVRSPGGREVLSVPKKAQLSVFGTGRGGAGNATRPNTPKQHIPQSQTSGALAGETGLAQQHKREQAVAPRLVTGRGGAGNFRKSKQHKSDPSLALSQLRPSSGSRTHCSSISTGASPPSTLSRLRGVVSHKRRNSASQLSITEPHGAVFPSLSLAISETDDLWSISDSDSYVIPESTFGALAEAQEDISSNRSIALFSTCYAGASNASLPESESHIRRRQPNIVAPFEEPPVLFYLSQMTPSSGRCRALSTNPPKKGDSRPSSPSIGYYAFEPRARPNLVPLLPAPMLPREQDAAPISPLSPPPRFTAPTPPTPHSPLPAGSSQELVRHRTIPCTRPRESGGRQSSFSSSSHRSSTPESAIEMEVERTGRFQIPVLLGRRAPIAPISRIPGQREAAVIPFEAIINPPVRRRRAVRVRVTPTLSVDSPARRIEIPDTPPQIPISIFMDPPPRSSSIATPRTAFSFAPTFRSESPASGYESFTPTFGTRPLPPLPAESHRNTCTSIAYSEYRSSPIEDEE